MNAWLLVALGLSVVGIGLVVLFALLAIAVTRYVEREIARWQEGGR